ncbi:MAG: DinB family protein [Anaerolineales bacterium]
MISALLIDLDDTLLANDMKRFLPVYLDRLGEHLSNLAPAEQITSLVMAGSLAMMENTDPTRTLQQVFADHFFPHFDIEAEDLIPEINQFYAEVFPGLQSLTAPRGGADQLIKSALDKGIEVVIATSPLFPLAAIEHRLDWAGVPVDRYAYTLVTSYESFHFAKPRLEYYAEILARLGLPPHQAAMIGNDPTDDLLPAQNLGLAVFDVNHDTDHYPGGDLLAATAWIERAHQEVRNDAEGHPQAILARLRGNLSALHSVLPALDETEWNRPPKKNAWAVNQILCHLRDVEREVYLPRVRTLMSEDNPHISAKDTDQWSAERGYAQQSGEDAFEVFTQARLDLIEQLESLTHEQWNRPARHSLLGPTNLAEILKFATDHDVIHLAQIRSNLKTIRKQ